MGRIKDNVMTVMERISEVCTRAGRSPSEVVLLAASKTRTVEEIVEAYRAGVKVFGENRVQEAIPKIEKLRGVIDAEWHMIGHLQTNKVKYAVKLFDLIHSVDSKKLVDEISKRAGAVKKVQDVLIEVKLSEEATKHGCNPEEVLPLAEYIAGKESIRLVGFMTMPPYFDDPEMTRPYFRRLREIRDFVEGRLSVNLPHLSMGMTADFEVAIEEGATIVRIGTAIFGER